MVCDAGTPSGPPARKKVRRARIRLELKGLAHPMAPPSPVEVSIQYADQDGVLELVPRAVLFTQHVGESGKMEPLPDTWLTRYCFHVRIEGETAILEQVADKYGHRLSYAQYEPPNGPVSNSQDPVRLEIGKPKAVFLNVPGGGPQWTLALVGIE